jgi:DNA-directed RNA polymerase subunit RPC12/RpoP
VSDPADTPLQETTEPQAAPAAAEKQFPCNRCGAQLDFAPGTSSLKCPYCGSENLITRSEERIEELDFGVYLARAAAEHETHEALRIKCEKCGAETTVPGTVAAGICPFCSANLVLTGKSSSLIKPRSLLPFSVTQKQAFENFRNWIRKLWFAPGDLKRYAQYEGRLAGVYVPFWTYDCEATTSYSGERGDYYWVTESYTAYENRKPVQRARKVRHTRWRAAAGTVQNSFDDILVLASKSLPRKYADRLEPWDLQSLVPYADEYLSGFRAESYQVDLAEGFKSAQEAMDPVIRQNIRRDIGGDEQRIHSLNSRYGKITFKHILLPVWMSAYRLRDKVYRILINARTGEVQGEQPYSVWKIAAAVAIALAMALLLALLASTKT